ncbi:MAG TPA: DUF445 family protein, partial [Gemmatimonadaceae bacterium]
MAANSGARVEQPRLVAPQPAPIADEAERQRKLDQLKGRATLLLVISGVVFVVARWLEARYPWVGYVRATAEASMVGGLADWFAVTALFRRPLGLPIPHTAIVVARKEQFGQTLATFFRENFLSGVAVAERMRSSAS